MIALGVAAVLVVVVVAALWSRVASSRVERRSVEGYGRALDTLGGVAKRSESGAPIHAPTSSELARPHVRPTPGEAERHARPAPVPIAPTPRIRLRPPAPPGQVPVFSDLPPGVEASSGPPLPAPGPTGSTLAGLEEPTIVLPLTQGELARPPGGDGAAPLAPAPAPMLPAGTGPAGAGTGGDEPLTVLLPVVPPEGTPVVPPEGTPVVPSEGWAQRPVAPTLAPAPKRVFDAEGDPAGGSGPGGAGPGGEERSQRMRRAATGAAAAVALGALGAGGWQLAADSGSHARASAPTTTSRTTSGTTGTVPTAPTATGGSPAGSGHPHGSSPPASTPTTLEPTSTTSSLVAYQAPARRYTVTFSVTGSSDCWIGAQASSGGGYLWMQTVPPGGTATYSATGPVVIRLGAPPVVSVSVNGLRVALPPGNVQPYDISFTPSSRAA